MSLNFFFFKIGANQEVTIIERLNDNIVHENKFHKLLCHL